MAPNTLKITYGQRDNYKQAARKKATLLGGIWRRVRRTGGAIRLNFENLSDAEQLTGRVNLQLLDI